MITAELDKSRHFVFRKSEPPQIKDDQLLIRVKYCGICGSDVHTFLGHNPFIQLPAVLGHEMIGHVEAVGPAVKSIRAGDRVTYEPTNHCGRCLYCSNGEYNLCLNRTPTVGSFRELTVLRERQVHLVPDTIPTEQAVLIEPLASAIHALDVADMRPGQRALILGSGSMGLLILAAAKQRGVQYAAVCNRTLPKLDIARKLGADEVIHTPESFSGDELLARAGEHAIDLVFDTVANSSSIARGLSVLKKGGALVLVGTPTQTVQADFSKILINELKIAGSLKYRHNFPEAIGMLSGNPGRKTDFDALISRKFPLKDIQQAFEEITANSAKYIKCLIEL